MIDYGDYIKKHPHWQKVRQARFDFDDGRCVICHEDMHGKSYQTHHLNYQRLGHERLRDVVTICDRCHRDFHNNWQKIVFWKGKEAGHWEVYSLEHTARLCAKYWREDRLINKDPDAPNLCSNDAAIQYIDKYFKDSNLDKHPVIDPHDVTLFVRNKRYELYFDAEIEGKSVEEFLNDYYGPKIRGKNPLRQEAGRKNGPFDHAPESFRRHYSENPNLNILMQEVKKYE